MCVPCVRYKELASLADVWSCEPRNTNISWFPLVAARTARRARCSATPNINSWRQSIFLRCACACVSTQKIPPLAKRNTRRRSLLDLASHSLYFDHLLRSSACSTCRQIWSASTETNNIGSCSAARNSKRRPGYLAPCSVHTARTLTIILAALATI